MTIRELIEEAIRYAGSEAKLGEATGYSQHGIWRAKEKGSVTPQLALAIHRATKGTVPASALRPDLWPTEQHVPAPPTAPSHSEPERQAS